MKRVVLFIFTMILSGCTGNGGGSKASEFLANPLPPSPEVVAAMNKYAMGLVSEEFNTFLLRVRDCIDELREGYRLSFPKDLEKVVSAYEQKVAALEANPAPTLEQIGASQNEGSSAVGLILSTGVADRAGLVGRYHDNLARIYGRVRQVCAAGRYGDNAVIEKNGWTPEWVKASFIKICQSKLEAIRSAIETSPEKLNTQEVNEVNDIEEKWHFFEEKKSFTDEDLTRLIDHTRMLPTNLDTGIDKQRQIYTNRINASKKNLSKLVDEFYQRQHKPKSEAD